MKTADRTNLFLSKETGIVSRVDRVDGSHAQVVVMQPKGLTSTYAMPLAEYDQDFLKTRSPLDSGDMALPASYRPPANWAEQDEPAAPDNLDPARGETAEGVKIGV